MAKDLLAEAQIVYDAQKPLTVEQAAILIADWVRKMNDCAEQPEDVPEEGEEEEYSDEWYLDSDEEESDATT